VIGVPGEFGAASLLNLSACEEKWLDVSHRSQLGLPDLDLHRWLASRDRLPARDRNIVCLEEIWKNVESRGVLRRPYDRSTPHRR
jgi:hypothetical protein